MGNPISKVVVIFLACLLLFIYPTLNMFQSQDNTTKMVVLVETETFVDSIRNIGYISPEMYKAYMHELSLTGNIYDVKIEHKHRNYDPVYDDPTNAATFKNDFNVNYVSYFNDEILGTLFPSSGTGTKYFMSKGDYIVLKVTNRNDTIATKIQSMLVGRSIKANTIFVLYGGMIKSEVN